MTDEVKTGVQRVHEARKAVIELGGDVECTRPCRSFAAAYPI
jgi:hypothetical protein